MEADAGEYIRKYMRLKRFPRINLHCKLVPVQYWEYEYGLFTRDFVVFEIFISDWKKSGKILLK